MPGSWGVVWNEKSIKPPFLLTNLLVCLSKVDPDALHHGPCEAYWAGIASVARSQVHTAHTWIAGMVFALGKESIQALVLQLSIVYLHMVIYILEAKNNDKRKLKIFKFIVRCWIPHSSSLGCRCSLCYRHWSVNIKIVFNQSASPPHPTPSIPIIPCISQ